MVLKNTIMGENKNNQIADSFFNQHFAADGEHACGSFETQEAIQRCYATRKANVPPPMPFVKVSKKNWDIYNQNKLTDEQKEITNKTYLKKHGINF